MLTKRPSQFPNKGILAYITSMKALTNCKVLIYSFKNAPVYLRGVFKNRIIDPVLF